MSIRNAGVGGHGFAQEQIDAVGRFLGAGGSHANCGSASALCSDGLRFKAEPDWATIHRELRRPGVALLLLWEEYRAADRDGYGWFIEFDHHSGTGGLHNPYPRRFFQSKPHTFLVAMALGSVAMAVLLPLLWVGRWFDFVPPPPLFFVFLVGATAAYLGVVEITKALFYRSTAGR